MIGFVGKHVAGQLSFEITYASTVYKKQQIEAFAEGFKNDLVKIITHAANAEDRSLTPSDIDYDGFDIKQLDDFMAGL